MSFVRVPPDGAGKRVHSQTNLIDGGATQVETQVMHIASGANPDHVMLVDEYGAAKIAFAEGAPSLDAFGNLRTSNAHMVGAYEYTNDSMADIFFDDVAGGGLVTYVPAKSSVVLSTTSGATDSALRVSHRYHFYQPGTGMFIIQTLQLGDIGKANNVRQWGYYDDLNGFYWKLDGTVLKVGLRSNTSGAVVNTEVPQSAWNGDKLDGTGLSGITLDVTKANFYWVDFAWLGVGTIRFGIEGPDGARVVVHTFENPNANVDPYMATPTLPVRWENYNTGLTSGTSEMKTICASVYSEGRSTEDYTFWRYSDMEVTNKSVTTSTPFLSVRSKLTFNGKPNRVTAYPDTLSLYVTGDPIKFEIIFPESLTSATWALTGISTVEGDTGATAYTLGNGYKFITLMLSPGTHNIDLTQYYELNDEGIRLDADGLDAYITTFAATRLSTNPTTVTATLTYRELR